MGHHHHHDHGHDHEHGHGRAFAIAIGANLAYAIIEATFGLIAGSLALIADAGHNLSDVLGLALAWGASFLARRAPTARRTYGFKRSPILAALGNAMLLLLATGAIAWEAIRRFFAPESIAADTVLWVAAIGVVVNAGTALLFLAGRHGDINIRGAFLHLVADAGVTIGVILAALVVMQTGWLWVDPLIGLAIALVILIGTWGLLRDSVNLALDAVPGGIDPQAVHDFLAAQPGVVEVHDLHIWALSTTETALTAHLVRPGMGPDDGFLQQLCGELQHRFAIGHSTIQLENGDPAHPCALAPAHVI